SGVGGKPVRSNVTRRNHVARSASATGVTLERSMRASRNRSIASDDHLPFFTLGVGAATGALKAQYSRPFSMLIEDALTVTLSARGSGAPIETHFSKSAMTASFN